MSFMRQYTIILSSFAIMAATHTGCADLEDMPQASSPEKLWEESSENNLWNHDSSSDNHSVNDQRADESVTSTSWGDRSETDNSSEEYQTTNSPQEVSSGSYCAPGCIWSSYAVQMGAQSAEESCQGQSCACVVNGDIWSSCSEESTSPSPESNANTENNVAPSHPGGYNATIGNQIADEAYYIASRRNTVGYCYNAAADAIEAIVGRFLWGASAYLAADQLAAHPRFTEVSVDDLRTLPAGAIVVWGRGSSAHGHISIALGDGREASDHIASQMTYHYGGARARVFYPN